LQNESLPTVTRSDYNEPPRNVVQVVTHPCPSAYENDLAILVMQSGDEFALSDVIPVDGVHGSVTAAEQAPGVNLTAAGFGRWNLEDIIDNRLRTVQLSIVTLEEQIRMDPWVAANFNMSKSLGVSGQTGQSTCNGDSGGPMLVKSAALGLVGQPWVLSVIRAGSYLPLGDSCVDEGRLGVSTRTVTYGRWIQSVLRNDTIALGSWVCGGHSDSPVTPIPIPSIHSTLTSTSTLSVPPSIIYVVIFCALVFLFVTLVCLVQQRKSTKIIPVLVPPACTMVFVQRHPLLIVR
jgi:hypothetical protein